MSFEEDYIEDYIEDCSKYFLWESPGTLAICRRADKEIAELKANSIPIEKLEGLNIDGYAVRDSEHSGEWVVSWSDIYHLIKEAKNDCCL